MINFQNISPDTFLKEYWQKKPCIIRNAIPNFVNPITPDELAGLALEEEIESRIVWETPGQIPSWHLKRGPFTEQDFQELPHTNWTLLVQGMDRLLPEVYELLDLFNFIPQWRIDDVMISFAAQGGSVGPHYDNYDVFLYQAQGTREWRLTTQECHEYNVIPDLELRIMEQFAVEEYLVLHEGDMLYLPPHVGHYGISRSEHCMTYSFGYRSYQGQELLDSLGDYLSEKEAFKTLYQDPDWSGLNNPAEIPPAAWQNAQNLLQQLIQNEELIKPWFGCFATRLDRAAEQQLPMPLNEEEQGEMEEFIDELKAGRLLVKDSSCRFAYYNDAKLALYINGCEWDIEEVSPDLVHLIANCRFLSSPDLLPYLDKEANQIFLHELWKLQWIQIEEIEKF